MVSWNGSQWNLVNNAFVKQKIRCQDEKYGSKLILWASKEVNVYFKKRKYFSYILADSQNFMVLTTHPFDTFCDFYYFRQTRCYSQNFD